MATQTSCMNTAMPVLPDEDERRLRAMAMTVSNNPPDRRTAFDFVLRAYQLGSKACHEATVDNGNGEPFSMVELERRAIAKALIHTRGNVLEAARLLGIGKTTLYRKLRRLKLNQDVINRYCCPVCGTTLDVPIVGSVDKSEHPPN